MFRRQRVFPGPSLAGCRARSTAGIFSVIAALLLASCAAAPESDPASRAGRASTLFPTPASDTLMGTGTSASGERLRIIVPAITLGERPPEKPVRVFVALVDPQGTYSYLLFPANRPGEDADQIPLVDYPLEIGISEHTPHVALWVLAYHATGSAAAQALGWDALATSLALNFREWLVAGDPVDDPLAGAIAASEGTLYPWFAEIEVLGQALTRLDPAEGWDTSLGAASSADGTLTVVFDVDYLPAFDETRPEADDEATPSPGAAAGDVHAGYTLVLDETFDDAASAERWYTGRAGTFINEVAGSGYQIRLLGASRWPVALSWGALNALRIEHGLIEAEARLAEDDGSEASYGLWLHHQDDNNFVYVGLSSRGEFRVAVIVNNRVQTLIQDWQYHPAIHTGSAANSIAVEIHPDGRHDLRVNEAHLLTFRDRTFGEGAIAFFCSAATPPATCRLETLRVWQPAA